MWMHYLLASYVTGRFTVVTISNCLTCDRKVYRGMSGVKLPECFMIAKEGGGKGGVDFAFVSTSTDRNVAMSYLGARRCRVQILKRATHCCVTSENVLTLENLSASSVPV